jgi:valyl-tRNA synthetase
MEKTYNPRETEDKWYAYWLEKGFFDSKPNPKKEAYTIVIPPPNVTGVLHMGHMLNNTLQDVLIRKARMEGKEACWVPGTDHASIATEAKVVKMLKDQGIDKQTIAEKNSWNMPSNGKKNTAALSSNNSKNWGLPAIGNAPDLRWSPIFRHR